MINKRYYKIKIKKIIFKHKNPKYLINFINKYYIINPNFSLIN